MKLCKHLAVLQMSSVVAFITKAENFHSLVAEFLGSSQKAKFCKMLILKQKVTAFQGNNYVHLRGSGRYCNTDE